MAQNQPTHKLVATATKIILNERETIQRDLLSGKLTVAELQRRFGLGNSSILSVLDALSITHGRQARDPSLHELSQRVDEALTIAKTAINLIHALRNELGGKTP